MTWSRWDQHLTLITLSFGPHPGVELWQQDGLADSGHALVRVGQNKNQKRPRYGYNTGPVEPFTLKHLDVDPCCWTDEGPAYCCITSPRPRDIWTLDEAPVCAGLDGFGRSCLKPWFHYLFNCIYLLVWRFQIWKHFSFAPEPKWHGQNETEGELVDFHTGVVQFSTWADN